MTNSNNLVQEYYNIDFEQFDINNFTPIKQKLLQENYQKNIFDINNRAKNYLNNSLEIAQEISDKYQNLVICGMGGSSLGAKALCGTKFFDLNYKKTDKNIYFLDNIHHQNLHEFLQDLPFENTAFLLISKSGNTIETICQALTIIDFYKALLAKNNAQNLYFITQKNLIKNSLAKIADNLKRPIITHENDIGGRYSCFSEVALIGAKFYGFDIEKYLLGGQKIMSNFINSNNDTIEKGVYFLQESQKKQLNIQIAMPYIARLYHFNYWYNQLLSESIGKNNQGITLLKAMGSVDQHSVLQLFLDGPKDKFFTFLTTSNINKGNNLIVPNYLKDNLSYLINNKLGDVINANQEATIKTIIDKNYLTRRFNINELNEYNIGQLMMHFMIETIFYAYTINTNPFDQPAVEKGKIDAKNILTKIKNYK